MEDAKVVWKYRGAIDQPRGPDFLELIHVREPLPLPAAQMGWGERSARTTLSTWAAELIFQKTELDCMERWKTG